MKLVLSDVGQIPPAAAVAASVAVPVLLMLMM
jgi:hypothetical protein